MPEEHNIVSLREYVERLMAAQCEANDARFSAMREALAIAEKVIDRRLEGMNEFRNSLRDQTKLYITAQEVTLLISRLEQKIDTNAERIHATERRSSNIDGRFAAYAVALAIVFTLVSIVLRFIP